MIGDVAERVACMLAWLGLAALPGSGFAAATQRPAEDLRLELPASFLGVLPAPDGNDVPAHLDLWPDGVYHLHRAAPGGSGRDDEIGRWRRDPGRPVILLYGGREMPLQFEVEASRRLRALGLDGKPADAGSRYDLSGDGKLHPTDVSRGLHGMFRYLADAAMFEECLTGRAYPVAMEADYLALERAYLAMPDRAPGAAVMASFDGDITQRPPMEGTGTETTVVVRRFVGLWPDHSCERAMSHASLAPQYWRIVSLRGEALPHIEGTREAHLILRGTAGGYRANAGCQQLDGQYRVTGTGLEFEPPHMTGDACPPAHRARQATLLDVLAAARRWSVQGQVLELFDAAGTPVAVLEAVYLR